MVTVHRGDVVLCDLNPVIGTEQAGIRPVVVVQIDRANVVSPPREGSGHDSGAVEGSALQQPAKSYDLCGYMCALATGCPELKLWAERAKPYGLDSAPKGLRPLSAGLQPRALWG